MQKHKWKRQNFNSFRKRIVGEFSITLEWSIFIKTQKKG